MWSGCLSLLLIFLTSLPSATQAVCCKSTFSIFSTTCCDDLCVAERGLDYLSNEPITNYYCLNKNANPHWRESCSGQRDTSTNVVQCCISEANCNTQLFPRLPSEPSEPTVPTNVPTTIASTNEPTAMASTNELTTIATTNETAATTSPTIISQSTNEDSTTEEYVSSTTNEVIAATASITTDGNLIECENRIEGVPLNGHPGYCLGKRCYVELNRLGNSRVWGCVDERFINCSAYSESKIVSCCSSVDRCNNFLSPTLPSERTATAGTATMGTATNGSTTQQTSPDSVTSAGNIPNNSLTFILVTIIVVLAVALLISITGFLVYILWRKHTQTKVIITGFTSPYPESSSDVMTSSADSSKVDLDTSL